MWENWRDPPRCDIGYVTVTVHWLPEAGKNIGAGPGCRVGRILDTYASKVSKNMSKMWPKSVQTQMCPKMWPKWNQNVSKLLRCPKLWPKCDQRSDQIFLSNPRSVQKCDHKASKNVTKKCPKMFPKLWPKSVQSQDVSRNVTKICQKVQTETNIWTHFGHFYGHIGSTKRVVS